MTLYRRVEYYVMAGLLGMLKLLPHRWRVPFAGWLTANVLAPLAGWRKRIREHLAMAMPNMPADQRRALERAVPDNMGRIVIELFSQADMADIVAATPVTGPGVAALDAALAEGRPTICVSGHFGNYDIFRRVAERRGFDVGGLYRPLNNGRLNERYLAAIGSQGGRLFERGRSGFAGMIKHLRRGGMLALLIDQHMDRGAKLTYFGKPAYTAVSAGQLALKYNAVLVPVYAIRRPDGLNFEVVVEAPIPHTDEETMTQALNDSLEAQVRKHPEQWIWTHRRWKERQKKKKA